MSSIDQSRFRQARNSETVAARLRSVLWYALLAALALFTTLAAAEWKLEQSQQQFSLPKPGEVLLVNPMRGLYKWRGNEVAYMAGPSLDAYERYYWRDLEPVESVYDFSALRRDLDDAVKSGKKFSFRVRTMAGYEDGEIYIPSYLVKNPRCRHGCIWRSNDDVSNEANGSTYIPDWNDPYLLERAEKLLLALAKEIDDEKSIGWIDIGMYGQWGEWYIDKAIDYDRAPDGIVPATAASKRALIDMHLRAFPSSQLVAFASRSNIEATKYAVAEQNIVKKPVGLRVDCIGEDNYFSQWTNHPRDYQVIKDIWREAPFIGEFCHIEPNDSFQNFRFALQQVEKFHVATVGNGNMGLGGTDLEKWNSFSTAEQAQLIQVARNAGYQYGVIRYENQLNKEKDGFTLTVKTSWTNRGNSPTYEDWKIVYTLVGSDRKRYPVASYVLPLKPLADAATPALNLVHTFGLETDLPPDTYRLELSVSSADGSRPPLKLINREFDGHSLAIGTLVNAVAPPKDSTR